MMNGPNTGSYKMRFVFNLEIKINIIIIVLFSKIKKYFFQYNIVHNKYVSFVLLIAFFLKQ
jgi:hypothetical protein